MLRVFRKSGMHTFQTPPQTWPEWGGGLGESYPAPYHTPRNMPQFGQQKVQTWREGGKSIGEYYFGPWTKHS